MYFMIWQWFTAVSSALLTSKPCRPTQFPLYAFYDLAWDALLYSRFVEVLPYDICARGFDGCRVAM